MHNKRAHSSSSVLWRSWTSTHNKQPLARCTLVATFCPRYVHYGVVSRRQRWNETRYRYQHTHAQTIRQLTLTCTLLWLCWRARAAAASAAATWLLWRAYSTRKYDREYIVPTVEKPSFEVVGKKVPPALEGESKHTHTKASTAQLLTFEHCGSCHTDVPTLAAEMRASFKRGTSRPYKKRLEQVLCCVGTTTTNSDSEPDTDAHTPLPHHSCASCTTWWPKTKMPSSRP